MIIQKDTANFKELSLGIDNILTDKEDGISDLNKGDVITVRETVYGVTTGNILALMIDQVKVLDSDTIYVVHPTLLTKE